MSHFHIIGAGMAGLSAAVELAAAGKAVTLYEAAPQAGGRCRSYHDPLLDRVLDNGTHLLLGCNRAVFRYLERIGAANQLLPLSHAFALYDLTFARTLTVRLPWRIPGFGVRQLPKLWRCLRADAQTTVRQCFPEDDHFFRCFIDPFTRALLNTLPDFASARMLGTVLRIALRSGQPGTQPWLVRASLEDTLVQPAVDYLHARGAVIHLESPVKQLWSDKGTLTGFSGAATLTLSSNDCVILAVPPWIAARLLPGLNVPTGFEAIINGHFALETGVTGTTLLGVLGGMAEWLCLRPGLLSTTTSAANTLLSLSHDAMAVRLWADASRATGLPATLPPYRIIVEKRATFAATPEGCQLRPATSTRFPNLFLAGDYTDTGLPATIEGSILSGRRAAELAIHSQTSRL